MLYSKNGSIPKPETDGTDGWIEVPEPPVAGDGEEVVWWFPPGWVVRPVKPETDGDWNWSQSEGQWVDATPITEPVTEQTATEEPVLTTSSDTVTATSLGTGDMNV